MRRFKTRFTPVFSEKRETKKYTSISPLHLIVILLLFSCSEACVNGQLEEDNSAYKNGMVVSAHPLASKVGLAILKKGGNAIDAAVAVQFALAVVYPNAGNIGGGGFLVYRSRSGQVAALDYRETAPSQASRNMYLDTKGNPIVDKSLYGHLAAGVPGSVDGMVKAHQKYGKLEWAKLIQPAIDLAEGGFGITSQQAVELNENEQAFKKYNPNQIPPIQKTNRWTTGDILKQEDLAFTLKLIQDKGRDGFYRGEIADLIVAEMKSGSGLISKEDLANYQSVWRSPITATYKNYKIITMPPPSSGGIALVQLLKSIESYPVKRWGYNSDSTIQFITEVERRVYADRATYLGDPDFGDVPQKQLLNLSYIRSRMKDFTWNNATSSTTIKAGVFPPKEREQTTHFSIVDHEGNAVAVTTTLNGSYGSKVFVKGAGFLLNNEMDDFSIKPGAPNLYGLVGGEANAIAPNKRMLSSMTPSILEKDGQLFMVVGTPGGSTIITSVFQTIIDVIEFNKSIKDAVASKRFHHQWLPDEIFMEKDAIDNLTQEKLRQKGYKLTERSPIGRVDAILKNQWGYYEGGADPRGDDTALGW